MVYLDQPLHVLPAVILCLGRPEGNGLATY